jgi:cytochrome b6-f complex iron-sulfur subunit
MSETPSPAPAPEKAPAEGAAAAPAPAAAPPKPAAAPAAPAAAAAAPAKAAAAPAPKAAPTTAGGAKGLHGAAAAEEGWTPLHPYPLVPVSTAVSRRGFLSWFTLGWGAFTAASAAGLGALQRFLFPNVTYEPPLSFKAGFPSEFGPGVEEKFKERYGVWIVRESKGFYALSTVCTHLGCTPNWLSAESKFKCPCHGSGFMVTGVNFEGPAPRPLERYRIGLAEDGQILVDKNAKFQQEKGEWDRPGAYLPIPLA